MQLNRIKINGFRHLINREFDFKPGLNVIYGPNEAGKSTLMQALLTFLYGFYDEGPVTESKRGLVRLYQPWESGTSYGGALDYELDKGSAYKVKRTFAPYMSTKLETIPEGKDVTGDYRTGSEGRLFFAQDQLGISKQVFENVCVVSQSEIALLENSVDAITEAIMRLSSTNATEGVAVSEAIRILDLVYRDDVGTERARTKPLSVAQKRFAAQEIRANQLRETQQQLFRRLNELKHLEIQYSRLEQTGKRIEFLYKRAQVRQLERDLSLINSVRLEYEKAQAKLLQYAKWEKFPYDSDEQVSKLDERRHQLLKNIKSVPSDYSMKIADLELQLDLLKKKNAGLEVVRQLSSKRVEQIYEYFDEWKSTYDAISAAKSQLIQVTARLDIAQEKFSNRKDVAAIIAIGHTGLRTLQSHYEKTRLDFEMAHHEWMTVDAEWMHVDLTEAQFMDLKEKPLSTKTQLSGCNPIHWFRRKKVQVNAPTPKSYDELLPVITRWKEARAKLKIVQKELDDCEKDIKTQLNCFDSNINSTLFEQFGLQIDQYLKDARVVDEANEVVKQTQGILAVAQKRNIEVGQKLQELLPEGYTEAQSVLADSENASRTASRLQQLQGQYNDMQEKIRIWQMETAALETVERDLHVIYAEASIESPLDDALAQYSAGKNGYNNWKNAYEESNSAKQHLIQVERDLGSASKQLKALEFEIETILAENPDWNELMSDKSVADYGQIRSQNQQQLFDIMREKTILKNDISKAALDMQHPAEADEDFAEIKSEIKNLQWFGGALQTAREELESSSAEFQREFAPRLQEVLNVGLEQAFSGRYTEARIDARTLAMLLHTSAAPDWVRTDQLSTGTRDLLYLLLRISIIQLMNRSGEHLPILLDDPFVHCDRERKHNALTYLLNNTSGTQFFLFTQDEWTRDWVTDHTSGSSLITLVRN